MELVQAYEEAIQLVNEYKPEGPSFVELKLKAGEGTGATEAPRGLLYHRYQIDENGLIQFAKITPPTAQNLPRIEADLFELAPKIINMPEEEATLTAEHLVRAYDPCISCATHFLKIENRRKMTKVAVIGIGQSLRGDDAAGLEAIRQWQEKFPETASRPEVRVEASELPGFALLDMLEDVDAAILVDAVQSSAQPGTIHRLSRE